MANNDDENTGGCFGLCSGCIDLFSMNHIQSLFIVYP